MKLLYITGDEYSAMYVEKEIGINKAHELAAGNGGSYTYESETTYAEIYIKEFGDVDPKFVDFIQDNFIDYDQSKDTDFFIIEE